MITCSPIIYGVPAYFSMPFHPPTHANVGCGNSYLLHIVIEFAVDSSVDDLKLLVSSHGCAAPTTFHAFVMPVGAFAVIEHFTIHDHNSTLVTAKDATTTCRCVCFDTVACSAGWLCRCCKSCCVSWSRQIAHVLATQTEQYNKKIQEWVSFKKSGLKPTWSCFAPSVLMLHCWKLQCLRPVLKQTLQAKYPKVKRR